MREKKGKKCHQPGKSTNCPAFFSYKLYDCHKEEGVECFALKMKMNSKLPNWILVWKWQHFKMQLPYSNWMLYIYTMKQFYSFHQKMHCIKLYYIYFKSICLFTIPLVDASTLLCLEVTSAEETNEHHHLNHLQDHIRQLFQDLDSWSWACALLAIFLL